MIYYAQYLYSYTPYRVIISHVMSIRVLCVTLTPRHVTNRDTGRM